MPSIVFKIYDAKSAISLTNTLKSKMLTQVGISDGYAIHKKYSGESIVFIALNSILPFYILVYVGIIVALLGMFFNSYSAVGIGCFFAFLYIFTEYFCNSFSFYIFPT